MLAFLANSVDIVASLSAQAQSTNATFNGTGIDIGEFEKAVLIHVNSPATTAGTVTYTVQDSADNSNWAAVPADYLVDPADGTADTFTVGTTTVAVDQTLAVKKENIRRYVRVVATTASSFNGTFSAFVVGFRKYS